MENLRSKPKEQPTPEQVEALRWNDGPMLVHAGPGSGKTRVLTGRISRILKDNKDHDIHVLALTYTNKAADEMRSRIQKRVSSDISDRAFIGTFHSFCTKILREYGPQIGIEFDFDIISNINDRHELLKIAIEKDCSRLNKERKYEKEWLYSIDKLRRFGINPVNARYDNDDDRVLLPEIYKIYEQALKDSNALDFNGLILNASRLIKTNQIIASELRNEYRYWLIDEFQDTTRSQFEFLNLLAGNEFKNIFIVADENQTIYQFAGANIKNLKMFKDEYEPEIINIDENRRCPASIVHAANRLIENNKNRVIEKKEQVSKVSDKADSIKCVSYFDQTSEARGIAREIQELPFNSNSSVAVLARTRVMLRSVIYQLRDLNIKATIAGRRDDFVTKEFEWLQNCLDLVNQPESQITLNKLTELGNHIADTKLDPSLLIEETETIGGSLMEHWAGNMATEYTEEARQLSKIAFQLLESPKSWHQITDLAIESLIGPIDTTDGLTNDAIEDNEAWQNIYKNICESTRSKPELPEFLQELKLRSKEPPLDKEAVPLYTIHSAKGLEFDHVWLAGMADSILPSHHSLKDDANPQLLEEERRTCFVGMTRAKKTLTITYAQSYKGRKKAPSRFLREMGLI